MTRIMPAYPPKTIANFTPPDQKESRKIILYVADKVHKGDIRYQDAFTLLIIMSEFANAGYPQKMDTTLNKLKGLGGKIYSNTLNDQLERFKEAGIVDTSRKTWEGTMLHLLDRSICNE